MAASTHLGGFPVNQDLSHLAILAFAYATCSGVARAKAKAGERCKAAETHR